MINRLKTFENFEKSDIGKYIVASPDVDADLTLTYCHTLYECLDLMLEVTDMFEFINNYDFNSTDELLDEIEIIPSNGDDEIFYIFEIGDSFANEFKKGNTLSDFFDKYNEINFNEWLRKSTGLDYEKIRKMMARKKFN
jgi:hypothetical protein